MKSGKRGTVSGKSRAYKKGERKGRNTRVNWGKCKWKLGRKYVVKATGRFEMTVLQNWATAVVAHGGSAHRPPSARRGR